MFLSFDGLFALMATPLSSLPPPTTSLLACLDLVCPPKPPVPPDPVPPEPPPPPLYSSVATDPPITDLNIVGLAFASGGIRSELWFSSCGVVSLGSRATFLLRLKCLPPVPPHSPHFHSLSGSLLRHPLLSQLSRPCTCGGSRSSSRAWFAETVSLLGPAQYTLYWVQLWAFQ